MISVGRLIQVRCGACACSPTQEELRQEDCLVLSHKVQGQPGQKVKNPSQKQNKAKLNNKHNKSHSRVFKPLPILWNSSSKNLAIFLPRPPASSYHLPNAIGTKHRASLAPTCPQRSCEFLYIYLYCAFILSFAHALINVHCMCLEYVCW